MYYEKSMWIDDCLLNCTHMRSWEKSCRKKLINCLLFCITSESTRGYQKDPKLMR